MKIDNDGDGHILIYSKLFKEGWICLKCDIYYEIRYNLKEWLFN